jgi:hypothetical protein
MSSSVARFDALGCLLRGCRWFVGRESLGRCPDASLREQQVVELPTGPCVCIRCSYRTERARGQQYDEEAMALAVVKGTWATEAQQRGAVGCETRTGCVPERRRSVKESYPSANVPDVWPDRIQSLFSLHEGAVVVEMLAE